MNDNELITLVRESFTDVHSATAVEQIASRSRRLRAKRLGLGGTAAAAAVLVVAAVVHVIVPASSPNAHHPNAGQSPSAHRGGRPVNGPPVQLAAWTVEVQPDGSVRVTFRQATDPSGLQNTLRADGVPASVTFSGTPNPACHPYNAKGSATPPAFGQRSGGTPIFGGPGGPGNPASQYSTPDALVIHPAALPSGAGLQIETSGTPGAADDFHFSVTLVKVSAQCTGS